STAGFYSYPKYTLDDGEIGIDKLTIVELKRPGIPIGKEQKDQAWKYVVELRKKGLIKGAQVTCFILGSEIDQFEGDEEMKGTDVRIMPMTYDIIVTRAKSRLLK